MDAPKTDPKACPVCGKVSFDVAQDCHRATVWTPAVGDWVCLLDGFSEQTGGEH